MNEETAETACQAVRRSVPITIRRDGQFARLLDQPSLQQGRVELTSHISYLAAM